MIRRFAIVGLGVFFSGLSYSQVTTSAPAFAVASVKVNTSGERTSANTKGDRLTMYNMPMKVIIALAYKEPYVRSG